MKITDLKMEVIHIPMKHTFKVAFAEEEEDLRALAMIREAVGPHIRLRVDANQGYDVPTASGYPPKNGTNWD